jgi:hypothetical protein
MGSVRDAGQWPGTIAREIAKYRGNEPLSSIVLVLVLVIGLVLHPQRIGG